MNKGLRGVTPAATMSQVYARNYAESPRIDRKRALQAVKRAAAAVGLKAAKIALLDQLFAYTKAQDWLGSQRPIVWPSNRALARALGISISTMKHHLRGLIEAGLVAYAASPTFQRRGRRDDDDNIIECYGLDLSPIAVRYVELCEIAAQADQAERERRALSYRRTVTRREIEGILANALQQQLDGPWQQLQARLDRLREFRASDLATLATQVDAMDRLLEECQVTQTDHLYGLNLDTVAPEYRPQQTTPQNPISEPCKDQRNGAHAPQLHAKAAFSGKASTDEENVGSGSAPQAPVVPGGGENEADIRHISLGLIREACPEVSDIVPGAFSSWATLQAAADQIGLYAGINPQVIAEARYYLGSDLAVVAVAITLQKHAAGAVARPGAYLRTLVKRGRSGELYLSRSLFALQNARAGISPSARH